MRPPDLPGGNHGSLTNKWPETRGFNEAAGFTRRKLRMQLGREGCFSKRFNEAAGFTRRKLGRVKRIAEAKPCELQ